MEPVSSRTGPGNTEIINSGHCKIQEFLEQIPSRIEPNNTEVINSEDCKILE